VAQENLATIGGASSWGPRPRWKSIWGLATLPSPRQAQRWRTDRIYLEGGCKVEFMAVPSGGLRQWAFTYTVTRNLDGTGANALVRWRRRVQHPARPGDGFHRPVQRARRERVPRSNGPTIVGNVRNSLTYNDCRRTGRWANLNGVYGYATTAYGFAAASTPMAIAS
jgi:hypothetical protein